MNKQKVKKFLSTLKDKMSMFEILVRIKLRFKTTYYPTNNKVKQTKKTKKASQTEIMNVYRNLKKSNPDLAFEDFCLMIAKGEVTLDKEDDGDEKE